MLKFVLKNCTCTWYTDEKRNFTLESKNNLDLSKFYPVEKYLLDDNISKLDSALRAHTPCANDFTTAHEHYTSRQQNGWGR